MIIPDIVLAQLSGDFSTRPQPGKAECVNTTRGASSVKGNLFADRGADGLGLFAPSVSPGRRRRALGDLTSGHIKAMLRART